MSFLHIFDKILKNKKENGVVVPKVDSNVDHSQPQTTAEASAAAEKAIASQDEAADASKKPFKRGCSKMIKLTRFNSQTNKKGEFVLNAEIIEMIEETPDTVITLTNDKKLIVEEPMDEVVRRVMKYRRALRQF